MTATDEFHIGALPAELREWQPEWGIVLGSGLGAFVEGVEAFHSLPFSEVRGLPVSSVAGHAGRFVFSEIAGRRAVIAQGRTHLYEGRTAREVAAGVRFLGSLGARRLILTNAAGTLNPAFAPGGWMMLSDHLNLTGATPLLGGADFFDMTEIYSKPLRETFTEAAHAEGMTLREGVYAGVPGPQYETPAEIRMLRALGADAVGMSTVIEAIQARALEMEIAAFSCLANWAAGLGGKPLRHADVLDAGTSAAGSLLRLVRRTFGNTRRAA